MCIYIYTLYVYIYTHIYMYIYMLYSFGIPQILLDTFCQDLLLAVLKHPKMGVDNFGAYLMFANPQICIADGSLIEDIYIYVYIYIYIYIHEKTR